MEKLIRRVVEQWGSRLDALLKRPKTEVMLDDLIHAFHHALEQKLDPEGTGQRRAVPAGWRLRVSPDKFRPESRARLDQWLPQIAASGQQYLLDHRQQIRAPLSVTVDEAPELGSPFEFVPVMPQSGMIISGLVFSFSDQRRPPIRLAKALSRQRATMGRSAEADIMVDDQSVSRFHATLSCDEDGRLYVSDCASANGTFVNGQPVIDRHEFRLGDEVSLGSVKLRLGYEGFDTVAETPKASPLPPQVGSATQGNHP